MRAGCGRLIPRDLNRRPYTPSRTHGRSRFIPPLFHPASKLLGFRVSPQSPGRLLVFLFLLFPFSFRLTFQHAHKAIADFQCKVCAWLPGPEPREAAAASQRPASGQPAASQKPASGQLAASQWPATSQRPGSGQAARQPPARSQPEASRRPAASGQPAASQQPPGAAGSSREQPGSRSRWCILMVRRVRGSTYQDSVQDNIYRLHQVDGSRTLSVSAFVPAAALRPHGLSS